MTTQEATRTQLANALALYEAGDYRTAAGIIDECVQDRQSAAIQLAHRLELHPSRGIGLKYKMYHELAEAYAAYAYVLSGASPIQDVRRARKLFSHAAYFLRRTTHLDNGRLRRSNLLRWAMNDWRARPKMVVAFASAVAYGDWRHAGRAVVVFFAGKAGENWWRRRRGRQLVP